MRNVHRMYTIGTRGKGLQIQVKYDIMPAMKYCRSLPLERAEEMGGSFVSAFSKILFLFSVAFFAHLCHTLQ